MTVGELIALLAQYHPDLWVYRYSDEYEDPLSVSTVVQVPAGERTFGSTYERGVMVK